MRIFSEPVEWAWDPLLSSHRNIPRLGIGRHKRYNFRWDNEPLIDLLCAKTRWMLTGALLASEVLTRRLEVWTCSPPWGKNISKWNGLVWYMRSQGLTQLSSVCPICCHKGMMWSVIRSGAPSCKENISTVLSELLWGVIIYLESLSHLLMIVNEGNSIPRTKIDYSTVQNWPKVVVTTSFTCVVEVIVQRNIEKRQLPRWLCQRAIKDIQEEGQTRPSKVRMYGLIILTLGIRHKSELQT